MHNSVIKVGENFISIPRYPILYSAILSFLHCDGRLSYYYYAWSNFVGNPALCHLAYDCSCGFLVMILIQVWMAVSISHLLLSHPDVNALRWMMISLLGTLFVKKNIRIQRRKKWVLVMRAVWAPHRHWINFPQGIRGTLAVIDSIVFLWELPAAAVYIQKLRTMNSPLACFDEPGE